jgi:hypothetical protein
LVVLSGTELWIWTRGWPIALSTILQKPLEMVRPSGTLTPVKSRKGHHPAESGDGLNLNTVLANAADLGLTADRQELQNWTSALLRAVDGYVYRQAQREACDRARLAGARREMAQ